MRTMLAPRAFIAASCELIAAYPFDESEQSEDSRGRLHPRKPYIRSSSHHHSSRAGEGVPVEGSVALPRGKHEDRDALREVMEVATATEAEDATEPFRDEWVEPCELTRENRRVDVGFSAELVVAEGRTMCADVDTL